MAMIERVGHDKRGNPIFKRDKYGNELLVPEPEDGFTSSGDVTSATSKTKAIDDQTIEVPNVFAEWKIKEGIVW